MKKNLLFLFALSPALLLSGCLAQDEWAKAVQAGLNPSILYSGDSALTTAQIDLGLKEALRVGTDHVVTQLGRRGGFNGDAHIRIPLPPAMARVHTALKTVGMGSLTNDLENRMNEAAELAVPEARELFLTAIRQMTIADARGILSGQQDAATQYLRRTMGPELAIKIQPMIHTALGQAGAVQAYDRVMGQYATLPFVSDIKDDMNAYVTEKALDGIFYYVAREEAAIRQNPAKRTTEILRTVFGS